VALNFFSMAETMSLLKRDCLRDAGAAGGGGGGGGSGGFGDPDDGSSSSSRGACSGGRGGVAVGPRGRADTLPPPQSRTPPLPPHPAACDLLVKFVHFSSLNLRPITGNMHNYNGTDRRKKKKYINGQQLWGRQMRIPPFSDE